MCWNALGHLYIPGTSVNAQFLTIFALLFRLGWKILNSKIIKPNKVEDDVPDENEVEKKKEKFNEIKR
jgi:hypothetical protein